MDIISTMNALSMGKQVAVVSALVEGNSIRSTARLTDVNRQTWLIQASTRNRRSFCVSYPTLDNLFCTLQLSFVRIGCMTAPAGYVRVLGGSVTQTVEKFVPDGSLTNINVDDNGVPVVTNVKTFNFVGDVIVTDAGGGEAQIAVATHIHRDQGIATFTPGSGAGHDYVDVTFPHGPFADDQYNFTLAINMGADDVTSPPLVWVTLPTVNGFRIRAQSDFAGEVRWSAYE